MSFRPHFYPLDNHLTHNKKPDGIVCWGYDVKLAAGMAFNTNGVYDVTITPPKGTKKWFPYPACTSYSITVYPCKGKVNDTTCSPLDEVHMFTSVVNISDGKKYRTIPLPKKGKVTLHPDFCSADVTSESSPLASGWDLLNEAITDAKSLISKQTGTQSGTKPGGHK